MRSDVRDVLRRRLGADAPVLDLLSDGELAELADVLAGARRAQARALAQASDEAMRQMPALLRVTVGRILER